MDRKYSVADLVDQIRALHLHLDIHQPITVDRLRCLLIRSEVTVIRLCEGGNEIGYTWRGCGVEANRIVRGEQGGREER
jgi:hypothetical protein